MFSGYPPNDSLELLINSQVAFHYGKRYGECFDISMKNHILNIITVCKDRFIISVVILKDYLTVELLYEILRHLMDELKTFKFFFVGNIKG